MKRLNLKWVNETIGEEYKLWKKGDIITIQAQTGTGKTYFVKNTLIPYMEDYEKMLIISNRKQLKRQLKKDISELKNIKIPKTMGRLDKISTVGNVTLLSYHQIAHLKNKELTTGEKLNLSQYDYIVCDECHWFKTDASFVNLTELAYKELIKNRHMESIMIYISATMEDTKNMIESSMNKWKESGFGNYSNFKYYNYSTGIDYSYLNTMYFKKIDDIITTIKNDKTDNKWIIFVTNKTLAEDVKDKLKNYKKVGIITADTKDTNKDLKSIINESKFVSDVLICTKCLDNGVNIQDDKVKNMVVMAWDRVTFIQEVGRLRINIENPYLVDLYICKKNKSAFRTQVKNTSIKIDIATLYYDNKDEFNNRYRNNMNKLPSELFYVKEGEGYVMNKLGYAKCLQDNCFYNEMVDKFSKGKYKEYSFIREQLSWIGQEKEFDQLNEILEVYDDEEIDELEEQLKIIYDKKLVFLTAKDRIPLIKTIGIIDKAHSNLKKKEYTYVKNIDSLNGYLEEINSEYRIKKFETSRIENGKKKNYKQAWKLIK